MTLVVGIIAKDGIVMVSDSRMSSTIASNDKVQKIFPLDKHNAVGVSGDGALGAHFLETIADELVYDKGIVKLVEDIREKGKQKFDDYYSHIKQSERPSLSFLIAGYTKNMEGRLYELSSKDNFIPRPSSTGFSCIGVPYFADYLLNRLYETEISVKQAEVMAAFCVIETGSQASGVGGDIKISSFSSDKAYSELSQTEINEIKNQCNSLHVVNKGKFYPENQ